MRVVRQIVTSVMIAGFMGALMAGMAAAQGATPAATPDASVEALPVAIHEGTCDSATAQPTFQVGNAVSIVADDDDDSQIIGQQAETSVLEASTTVEGTLEDLGEPQHVVAVHASEDQFGEIVACGQIAGTDDDGRLVVALTPVGESTVAGVAILDSDDAGFLGLGDDEVQVTVYLFDMMN